MPDDARIAEYARQLCFADAERKLRKQERAYAIILANKAGAQLVDGEFPHRLWKCTGGHQLAAVGRATKAHNRYLESAKRVASLRAALRRACKAPPPKPHEGIQMAYQQLCEAEKSAASATE